MPRLSPPIVLLLLLLPASWLSTAAGQGLHASGIELYSRSRRDAGAGGVYEYKAPRYTEAASWGYVEVRPLAHMFWWLQPYKQQPLGDAATGTPLIIWLQGGPGASGTGTSTLRLFYCRQGRAAPARIKFRGNITCAVVRRVQELVRRLSYPL